MWDGSEGGELAVLAYRGPEPSPTTFAPGRGSQPGYAAAIRRIEAEAALVQVVNERLGHAGDDALIVLARHSRRCARATPLPASAVTNSWWCVRTSQVHRRRWQLPPGSREASPT
nr:hypothetical protein JVH1_0587 [Rhodococcus sp. JVH1]